MRYPVNEPLAPFFMINEFLAFNDKFWPSYNHIINLTNLAIKLGEFRKVLGRMDITSGWRSRAWNTSVGGDLNSYHLQGLAADFERKNDKGVEDWGTWTPETLAAVANYIGFGNIGVYLRKGTKSILWVHVDIGKPWSEGNGWKRYSNTMSFKIYEK
jgi:hypothetical protein